MVGCELARPRLILILVLAVLLPAAPAAAQPLAQWRFDEGGGQVVADAGPSGLDGRLGALDAADSADPVRIAGRTSGALRFDGQSFVTLPRSSALAPATLTAEAVVRAPSSPGPWRYIISRGSSGCVAGAYGLYTGAAGGVGLYVFDGQRYLVSATARPSDVWDGGWHRVTGTFDGTALRLYVDGRPVGAPMPAPLQIDYETTSSRTLIGQYGGDCDLGFAGDIDELGLWGSALSAGDVAAPDRPPGTPPGPLAPLPAADGGTASPARRRRPGPSPLRGTAARCARPGPASPWDAASSCACASAGSAAPTAPRGSSRAGRAAARPSPPAGSARGAAHAWCCGSAASRRSCSRSRAVRPARPPICASRADAQTTRPWRMVFSVTTRGSTNCSR